MFPVFSEKSLQNKRILQSEKKTSLRTVLMIVTFDLGKNISGIFIALIEISGKITAPCLRACLKITSHSCPIPLWRRCFSFE